MTMPTFNLPYVKTLGLVLIFRLKGFCAEEQHHVSNLQQLGTRSKTGHSLISDFTIRFHHTAMSVIIIISDLTQFDHKTLEGKMISTMLIGRYNTCRSISLVHHSLLHIHVLSCVIKHVSF